MERICNANFFRSSPERPGFVERSTFLMDEDDLTCRVHDVSLAEDGLVGAASIMMFITVAYIGTFCSVINSLIFRSSNWHHWFLSVYRFRYERNSQKIKIDDQRTIKRSSNERTEFVMRNEYSRNDSRGAASILRLFTTYARTDLVPRLVWHATDPRNEWGTGKCE